MVEMRRRALVICLNDLDSEPRPLKNLKYLANKGFKVDVICAKSSRPGNWNSCFLLHKRENYWFKIVIKVLHKLNLILNSTFLFNYLMNVQCGLQNLAKELKSNSYDIIFVEDVYCLPFAFQIKKKSRILFDAREYYPEQFSDNYFFNKKIKPVFEKILKRHLKHCDYRLTVSHGIAQKYLQEFNVPFTVIRNVPEKKINKKTENGFNKTIFRMVHHGIANRNRKIENMIYILNELGMNYSLDFYLNGEEDYLNYLKRIAINSKNIAFYGHVQFDKIHDMLQNYDAGLYYLEPSCFNTEYCLPNKFFEFIQARLIVFSGPSFEMKRIIKEYNCGVVSDNFSIESMVNAIKSISTSDLYLLKRGVDIAANDLCFDIEYKKLDEIILES